MDTPEWLRDRVDGLKSRRAIEHDDANRIAADVASVLDSFGKCDIAAGLQAHTDLASDAALLAKKVQFGMFSERGELAFSLRGTRANRIRQERIDYSLAVRRDLDRLMDQTNMAILDLLAKNCSCEIAESTHDYGVRNG